MGNASKMVPIGVFNKLRVSMAMGGKYTYPPFMFMKNHDDMKLFRRVVEKLIAKHGSQKAKELVQKIAYIRDEHPGATYDGQPVNQILVDLTHQLWKDH
ncbi:MAG TPA: hypothetical protein PK765_02870 [bacterium]|nr:hypothetical protein [bacterium]